MKRNFFLAIFSFLFLSLQAQEKLKVFVFIAEECPISIYMARPLQQVVKTYQDKASFHAVFPLKKSTNTSANQFLMQYNLPQFNVILDRDQSITKSMQAMVTPEVVVTDLEDQILYRGRISDAYRAPGKMKHGVRKNELREILGRLLDGQAIAQPWPDAIGCFITFYNKS